MKEKIIKFLKGEIYNTAFLKRSVISAILYLAVIFWASRTTTVIADEYKLCFMIAFLIVSVFYASFSTLLWKKGFHSTYAATAALLCFACIGHQLLWLFGVI